MAEIGVVIVTFGAAERAARLALDVHPNVHSVVVVSNGADPHDRTAAEALWQGAWLHLANPGFGAAANAGVSALPDEVTHVAVLEDDVTLGPGVLAGLAAELTRDDVGLVGPELVDARDGSIWSHGGTILGRGRNPHHLRPDREPAPTLWLDTAVVMLRRDDFVALGGFDEHFFLYYEDVDLGLRLQRDLGRRVVCRTDLSATKVPDDHLTLYLDTRNRLRLQLRHHRYAAAALLIGECLGRMTVGSIVSPGGAVGRFRDRARALVHGLRRPSHRVRTSPLPER